MTTFQKNLMAAMDRRGYTQRRLAEVANTKEATISRYINGVNISPNISILVNIAKALDVSTDYLLGISDIPKQKPSVTSEELALVDCYRRASSDDRDTMIVLLRKYMTDNDKEAFGLTKDAAK